MTCTHHGAENPYFFPVIFANMICHTLIAIPLCAKEVLDMYVQLSKASNGALQLFKATLSKF